MRDKFRGSSLPEKIQYLATQKMKARNLRNSMMFQVHSFKEAEVTEKIIKYSTFLSHKMIDKIKTQELKMFENEVKEVCCKQKSVESCHSEDKRLGISRFLQEIKTQTKKKLFKQKCRRKTEEGENNCLSPKYHLSPNRSSEFDSSPPQSKLKFLIELKRKRNIMDKRRKLKGVVLKSSLVEMMQKLESLNLHKVIEVSNTEESVLLTHKLKEEKQRLNTVLENGTIQFQPIGNVNKNIKNNRYNYGPEKKSITQMPSNSKKKSDTHHKHLHLQQFNYDSKKGREQLMIVPFNKGGSKNSVNTDQKEQRSMKEYVQQHIH